MKIPRRLLRLGHRMSSNLPGRGTAQPRLGRRWIWSRPLGRGLGGLSANSGASNPGGASWQSVGGVRSVGGGDELLPWSTVVVWGGLVLVVLMAMLPEVRLAWQWVFEVLWSNGASGLGAARQSSFDVQSDAAAGVVCRLMAVFVLHVVVMRWPSTVGPVGLMVIGMLADLLSGWPVGLTSTLLLIVYGIGVLGPFLVLRGGALPFWARLPVGVVSLLVAGVLMVAAGGAPVMAASWAVGLLIGLLFVAHLTGVLLRSGLRMVLANWR